MLTNTIKVSKLSKKIKEICMNLKNIIITTGVSLLITGCLVSESKDCDTSSTNEPSSSSQSEVKIPFEGLIAYYPFNSNAKDESNNTHDGEIIGAQINSEFTTENTTLEFNGTSDYVELDKLEDLNSSLESFSISFWIKSDSKNTNKYQSVLKTINSSGSGTMLSLEIHRGPNSEYSEGVIRLDVRDDSDKYFVLYANKPEVFDNNWHNITFVVSSSLNNEGAVYIDGVLDTSDDYNAVYGKDRPMGSPSNFSEFDFNLVLGAGNNRGNIESFFKGSLDEFAFYDRALELEDLDKLYNR